MSAPSPFGVWRCPPAGHVNDAMRHTCRDCGAHRPCEHYDGRAHCGAVPVHMYHDGPRCAAHRVPVIAPGRAGPGAVGAGGHLDLDLPEEFTVGEWARAVRVAADRVPRQLEQADGTWRANPARAAAEREVSAALRAAAGHLGIPLEELGPCSACRAYCHKYGPSQSDPRATDPANHGRPLCPACLAAVEARRQAVRAVPEPIGRAA